MDNLTKATSYLLGINNQIAQLNDFKNKGFVSLTKAITVDRKLSDDEMKNIADQLENAHKLISNAQTLLYGVMSIIADKR